MIKISIIIPVYKAEQYIERCVRSLMEQTMKENIEFITTTTMFDNYTIEQMSNTFILAYLRGVSTQKGQEIIEDYIKKQTK